MPKTFEEKLDAILRNDERLPQWAQAEALHEIFGHPVSEEVARRIAKRKELVSPERLERVKKAMAITLEA